MLEQEQERDNEHHYYKGDNTKNKNFLRFVEIACLHQHIVAWRRWRLNRGWLYPFRTWNNGR